ncbi:Fe-S protein assembly co-chaperone HscB [Parasulfuritortus cantonensis]|uniref:Co-chaperone protein HscB homolog n=1 Tax=Parasulfuritortus cantonensis TaxID=2528202 RepID=A0A4V2NX17_9PROT|nr:Fe-S protein assembly co-chaperone HscB [Parasulfuritortus cantonensis]TCJ19502.1 Fe-S protein assembly co-chaperone HscB [Parasulfuritortus cantonensis]
MAIDFNQNHFALFGLTPAFAVDLEALDRAYRELQTEIHPDRFAHAGEADQRLAVQWATRANEAYQALKHPFARACYLLLMHGIDAMAPGHAPMPMAFLERQMASREALAEAVANADYDALGRLEKVTRNEAERLLADVAELLDGRQDYAGAAEVLRQYRFLEKFLADVGHAYDEME